MFLCVSSVCSYGRQTGIRHVERFTCTVPRFDNTSLELCFTGTEARAITALKRNRKSGSTADNLRGNSTVELKVTALRTIKVQSMVA